MNMRIVTLFALLNLSNFMFAQERILTTQEIEVNEQKVITAFEKFQKKPKNKRVKEKFISRYDNSISEYKSRLNILSESSQLEDKNWEGQINALKSLQYLNVLAKSSNTTSFIITKNYAYQIDSISDLATISLYNKGKESLARNENAFALEIAYGYFHRVLQLNPNYNDTKQLIDLAILKGTKTVYFEPVRCDNLGNYFEWGSNNSSASSDYIITSLLNDLSIDNVGSRFINDKFTADRIVEMKWVSINISPERNNKYSFERSRQIKENGVEKTVYATVNYNERYKDVTGQLNVRIKDVKTQDYIVNKQFSGTTFFSKTEANYKGDERALTNEDNNTITNTNAFISFNPEGYELTTKMYSEAIHNQVLYHIGRLLNWNYESILK